MLADLGYEMVEANSAARDVRPLRRGAMLRQARHVHASGHLKPLQLDPAAERRPPLINLSFMPKPIKLASLEAFGRSLMHKLPTIALAGFMLAVSQPALAEIVNLTNSASGENPEKGRAAVKAKLVAACTERGGTPDEGSFEVVFEKTSSNPEVPKPYYVDGKMKCDLPG